MAFAVSSKASVIVQLKVVDGDGAESVSVPVRRAV